MAEIEKIAEKIGYIFSYFLFTTLLFFILGFMKKMPPSWTYFHIATVTIFIALAGATLRRFLYGRAEAIF